MNPSSDQGARGARDPSSPSFIDSHCHLQHLAADDRERALDEARARGIDGFLVPATRLSEAAELLALAHRHADVWCALGVHPHEASSWQSGDERRLAELLADPRAVAVGECGLDFHYDHSPRSTQLAVLRSQWELAMALGLPVVVHNRESDDEMSALLSAPEFAALKADFHSFAGGRELAQRLVAGGAYFGFSGMVTFRKADNVREILGLVPQDRILLETDTPYLAPVPHRGKPNRPTFLHEVAERVAQELGLDLIAIGALTTTNFRRLFSKAQ